MIIDDTKKSTTLLSPKSSIEILNPNDQQQSKDNLIDARKSPLALLAATCSNVGKSSSRTFKDVTPYSRPSPDTAKRGLLAEAKSDLEKLQLFHSEMLRKVASTAYNSLDVKCGSCPSTEIYSQPTISLIDSLLQQKRAKSENSCSTETSTVHCNWVSSSGVKCGQTFPNVDAMMSHIRTFHATPQQKPANPLQSLSDLSHRSFTPPQPLVFTSLTAGLGLGAYPYLKPAPLSFSPYLYPTPFMLIDPTRAL